MSNKFMDWFGKHFSTISILVALLNLLIGNYVIGSLWVLIFLTDYQHKMKN